LIAILIYIVNSSYDLDKQRGKQFIAFEYEILVAFMKLGLITRFEYYELVDCTSRQTDVIYVVRFIVSV